MALRQTAMGNAVDLIPFLARVMEGNTRPYRSDFSYDVEQLTKAVQEPNMEERVFYWMSRPAGTWCVKEREVFLRGTSAHTIWTYYADQPEEIKAYRVTVMGREDGRIMGSMVPLDYREQVRRVQSQALPAVTLTIQYESGHTVTLPYLEPPKKIATALPGHGGIRRIRYAPENEAELARVIMEEHRWQTGKVKKPPAKHRPHPGR